MDNEEVLIRDLADVRQRLRRLERKSEPADAEPHGQTCGPTMGTRGPSARDVLLQRVEHLRIEASQLEALSNQLPVEMTPDAAAALIRLVTRPL
jgi:hypothetical protein